MKVQRSAEKAFRQLSSAKTGERYSLSAVLFEAGLFVHHEILEPGKRSSAPHRHAQAAEVVYILKGEITAIEGSERIYLQAGDSACFEPSDKQLHWIENHGADTAELLVIRPPSPAPDVHF